MDSISPAGKQPLAVFRYSPGEWLSVQNGVMYQALRNYSRQNALLFRIAIATAVLVPVIMLFAGRKHIVPLAFFGAGFILVGLFVKWIGAIELRATKADLSGPPEVLIFDSEMSIGRHIVKFRPLYEIAHKSNGRMIEIVFGRRSGRTLVRSKVRLPVAKGQEREARNLIQN